ncbi:hypothetical protein [Haladaptatus halobius]|uniref:hypothetical protein n=1 Tax=Haladaptatus halobius TaxID=2884875 RepID=UPI001D0B7365|nr:hypothetical protein [Haladaptatus halobius]
MKRFLQQIASRFVADSRKKAMWSLTTIHNLVLLFTAGLVMAATGWTIATSLDISPTAAPTSLIVLIPAVIIGFGSVYGSVALWSYKKSRSGNGKLA